MREGWAGLGRRLSTGQRDHDLAGACQLLRGGGGLFPRRAESGFHARRHGDGEGHRARRDDDVGQACIAGQVPTAGDFHGGKGGFDGSGEFGIGHGRLSVGATIFNRRVIPTQAGIHPDI